MAYDGTLKFDTKINPDGFQKGVNKLGTIVKGAAVFKALSAGVDMVKSSIDKAFGRIDTMEQFDRVMNVMTGDAEKTNKALEKTNTVVKGTAYGLDVASKAVQSFVSRGMGVEKSTKTLESFADAVAFYGDGTNATLESVMSALGKMQTKGNVTMEHLEMLFNAGIPAVEIYANAVGTSTTDVMKAMSKGQLKTDAFINTLNNAFRTGVEGFPSIAGAAKEAGASWQGTFDNMKAAVTRGTQAIITNIDKTLESIGKPSTRETIANFGRNFEKALNGIAGVAGPVVEHLDLIAFGVSAVGAAIIGLKVGNSIMVMATNFDIAAASVTKYTLSVSGAVTADTMQAAGLTVKQVLVGVLSGQIGIATAAQWAWNAAMYANPIGMIIAAIGVLIVAMIGLQKSLDANTTAYEENKAAIDDTIAAQNELTKAIDEGQSSYEENLKNENKRLEQARGLISTINELSRIENKSADDKLALSSAVRQLNTMYAGLNLSYDKETGKLNKSTKAVEEYINAKANITKAEQAQERLIAIQEEQIANEKTVEGLQERRRQLEWDYLTTNKYTHDGYMKQLEELNAIETTYFETKNRLNEEAIGLEKQLEAANTESSQKIIDNYEFLNSTMTKNGQTAQELADEWGITGDEMIAMFENLNAQSLDELVQTVEENTKQWQESFESHKDAVVNSFEEIPAKFDMSAKEMTKVLNTNAERYSQWQKNITELSKTMSAESIAELKKLGPAANSVIEEMLENSDKAEAFDAAMRKNIEAAVAATDAEIPSLIEAGSKAGDYLGEGLSGNTALPEGIKEQMTGAKEQVKASVHEIAESIDTTELSEAMKTGIETGIENGIKDVLTVFSGLKDGLNGQWNEISKLCVDSVTSITKQIQVGFRTGTERAYDIVKKKLEDIQSAVLTGSTNAGIQLINGMIAGLNDNAWRLNAKADRIAQGVIDRMNKAFDIHSPSRVTESMFRYVVLGGVKGFDDEKDTLYAKADEINTEVLDRLDADPELCASAVEFMRDIVSNKPWDAARLSPALSPAYAGAGTQYTSNFTQIINSPKALSASEMSQEAVDAQRRQSWKIP